MRLPRNMHQLLYRASFNYFFSLEALSLPRPDVYSSYGTCQRSKWGEKLTQLQASNGVR